MAPIQRQRHLVELAPVAAGRLLESSGLWSGMRAAAAEIRFSCLRSWSSFTELAVGLTETRLLRRCRRRHRDDEHERQRADDETSVCKPFCHATSSLFLFPAAIQAAPRRAAAPPG